MSSCTRCGRTFKVMTKLIRHVNNRQTPCRKPTHHCNDCGRGFGSRQSLWNHQQICQSAPSIGEKRPFKEISRNDTQNVFTFDKIHQLVNTSSSQSPSFKLIPYIESSPSQCDKVNDMIMSPTKHSNMKVIPSRLQKKVTNQLRI